MTCNPRIGIDTDTSTLKGVPVPRTSSARTAIIRSRVDARRKTRVDRIFLQFGLTTTEAINLFYAQVDQRRALPFNVVVACESNDETLRSLRENVSAYPAYDNVEALTKSLSSRSRK